MNSLKLDVTHAVIDTLHPDKPKRVLFVVSNPAVSPVSGLQVGFWWAELSQAYWEFTQVAYEVDFASPQGGEVRGDGWSDPDHEAGFSDGDLISRGFKNSPKLMAKLHSTPVLDSVDPARYDALFLIGGQGPMVTFVNDDALHRYVAAFYEAGKITAVVCHATSILLKTRLSSGKLLAEGKSWTGSAKLEETLREDFVGRKLYPFYIQEEAEKIDGTNYVALGPFREHAIRDGNLITGQQQYSAVAAARLVIAALGR